MGLLKKILVCLAIICLICPALSQQALAATTIDGLEITFDTDKTEYTIYDSITANFTITNTNDTAVTNLRLESLIPVGYEISTKDDNIKLIDALEPGDSVKLTLTLHSVTPTPPPPTEEESTTPDTPDTSTPTKDATPAPKEESNSLVPIILYALVGVVGLGIIAVIVVIVVKKSKAKSKEVLSILLCIAVVGGLMVPASAQLTQSKLQLTHNIKVGDGEITLQSVLTYDEIGGEKKLLTVDTEGMLYNAATNTYHVTKAMSALKGTLLNPENFAEAVCEITDVNGNQLLTQTITPANMWSVDNFALIVGINNVKLTFTTIDGAAYETALTINNVCAENMESLNVDKNDDDNDGVLNFIEMMHHTDPSNPDSDGDGLTDYDELAILGTDPLAVDTDQNGVNDPDEDADGDGLTNLQEIQTYLTNPITQDSDGDGLSDQDELTTHLTNPNLADTDSDGKNDYWEIQNGYDPLVVNTDFPVSEEPIAPDNITVESDGYVQITEVTDSFLLNESTPGYIGSNPIFVDMEENCSANITMKYNAAYLKDDETPTLYYFNESTQSYEEVTSEIDADGNVKATITKKGMYVLLNHRFVDDVWQNDIFRPSEFNKQGCIDVVFVLDRSKSMDENDPNNIRKLVTKEFIGKLRDGMDRAAVVQFNAIGETVMPMTYDKEALCNAVDAIENSDGGGCSGSDSNAGTNGSAGLRAALTELEGSTADYKYIIFLTDGADTTVSEDYGDENGTFGITGEARQKGIIIHTVGLVGSGDVDVDLLKRVAEGAKGKYFLATVGEDAENNSELVEIYDDIESITIDRHLDSNNDGISDYYTKLICEGKLCTGTGIRYLFGGATYDEVQASADLDNDGLTNGTELEIIENDKGVFAKINSLPYTEDSDSDTLLDLLETSASTNPMKKNGNVDVTDATWVTNSSNFMSDLYLDLYNSSPLERGSVFIGNAFFGTTLDQTNLYRKMLIDYFVEIDKDLMSSASISVYRELGREYINAVFDQIGPALAEAGESGDSEGFLAQVGHLKELVSDSLDIASLGDDSMEFAKMDEALLKLINLGNQWNLNDCNYQIGIIQENMAHVPGIVSADTKASWTKYLNEMSAELAEYRAKAGVLTEKIEINTKKFKSIGEGLEFMGNVMMVIEWGENAWDAHMTYCDLIAALGTVKNNAYILDCILASSNNTYLTLAARDLKFYINTSFSRQQREFIMQLDLSQSFVTSMAMDLLHDVVISSLGVPGTIIELVRDFGNVVFKIDEMSQAAAETVALAASADILAANYLAHLEGGYAVKYDNSWIGYADYSYDLYISILNLLELRMLSETKISQWQSNETLLNNCKTNVSKCNELIGKYNARYAAFFT